MTAEKLNRISHEIIASAIEVHNRFGPGLLEVAYRKALAIELRERGLKATEEVPMPVSYKGINLGISYRMDLLVEECVIVECKTVEAIIPIHANILRSYLCLSNLRLGLIINFRERLLTDGLRRVVNEFPDIIQK